MTAPPVRLGVITRPRYCAAVIDLLCRRSSIMHANIQTRVLPYNVKALPPDAPAESPRGVAGAASAADKAAGRPRYITVDEILS